MTLPPHATLKRGLGTFFLYATDEAGTEVHQFATPLALTVRYTPEQLQALGIAEGALTLSWYDPVAPVTGRDGKKGAGRWVRIPTEIDRTAHTATVTVDHFSAFHLSDGSSPSDAFIPSVKGWQVSPFTGAFSYSIPIDVPAGPGGIRPALALAYNSAATDGHPSGPRFDPVGWAGKGWDLGTGYVARRKINEDLHDPFTLVLNGRSFDLVNLGVIAGQPDDGSPDHYSWGTTDEAFLRVTAIANGNSTTTRGGFQGGQNGTPYRRFTWRIWATDGMRYDYSDDLWWGWEDCGTTQDVAPAMYMEAYRWNLSQAVDPHGNAITYTYARQSNAGQRGACSPSVTNWYGTIDIDSWPTAITWGANAGTGATDRYRVEFLSVARTWDTLVDSPPTQTGGTPTPTRLLSAVKVESMQASAWETVSQYTLTADSGMFNDEDTSDNNANVLPSYKKITLRSVQRVGSDGTSALPATTFTYGLTRGTPGAYYLGDWNRLKSVGNGQGGTVSIAYEHLATAVNDGAFFNIRRVTSVTVADGRGQSAIWHYAYTNPEVNSLDPPPCTNPPSPLPPCVPSPRSLNSAALYLGYHWGGYTSPNSYNSYELLAAPPGTEFRGHASTTITDPNGVQTIRSFYQGDTRDAGATACTIPSSVQGQAIATYNNDPCFQRLRTNGFLVGREYQTEVRGPTGAGSPLYRRTQRTFTVGSYNYGSTFLTGLWNAWTYTSQAVETNFEGGGTGTSRTTKYTYLDSGGNRDPFGDLLAVEEDDPLSVRLEYRRDALLRPPHAGDARGRRGGADRPQRPPLRRAALRQRRHARRPDDGAGVLRPRGVAQRQHRPHVRCLRQPDDSDDLHQRGRHRHGGDDDYRLRPDLPRLPNTGDLPDRRRRDAHRAGGVRLSDGDDDERHRPERHCDERDLRPLRAARDARAPRRQCRLPDGAGRVLRLQRGHEPARALHHDAARDGGRRRPQHDALL